MKRLIVTADDFGLSEGVNEAVERAHRNGILSAASLMVAGPAAADAVRRAKSMPSLRVGLHLVVIEGPAVLPHAEISALVNDHGQFPSHQFRLGMRYFFNPRARRQLRDEIDAQFASFAATGLKLDHANAHKHMHLHPTVGRMLMEVGRSHGLPAIRIPSEPASVLGVEPSVGDRALFAWTGILRRQARKQGLATNDHCFGILWSGAMTEARVASIMARLPEGVSEMYFHPAAWRDGQLTTLMPNYAHEAELIALLSPSVRNAIERSGARRVSGFAELGGRR